MSGTEPDRRNVKDSLERQMAAFEQARIEAPVDIQPMVCARVLVVHDGTDQDATSDALAAATASQYGVDVFTHKADPRDADAYQGILAAAEEHDIAFVPCPFGRDYAELKTETLSTTIDLLLSKARWPMCLVRGPVADPKDCMQEPAVILDIERHRNIHAAEAAASLARGGHALRLFAGIDPHVSIRDEELLGRQLSPGDLSVEVLEGLASARSAGLVSALQKNANEWNITPQVSFAIGDPVETALDALRDSCHVIVAGCNRKSDTPGAASARRLVLRSALPVLLV